MKAGILLVVLSLAVPAAAQPFEVTGAVTITWKNRAKAARLDQSNVVVWLKPAGGANDPQNADRNDKQARFEIRQVHKRFEPHILAVPVGSAVWFPNLDPFFHNVFSLYDGNRFDLGLYEAGATHSVRFDRPGVCFIFCNIHPEMSAVVVAVDGPYGISNAAGRVCIPNVAAGRYLVYAWHERARSVTPAAPPLEINIATDNQLLPPIALVDSGELIAPHKNKYGVDYAPPTPGVIYR